MKQTRAKKIPQKKRKYTRKTQKGGLAPIEKSLKSLCDEYYLEPVHRSWGNKSEPETLQKFQEIFSSINSNDTIILKIGANDATSGGGTRKDTSFFLEKKIIPRGNTILIFINSTSDSSPISFYPFEPHIDAYKNVSNISNIWRERIPETKINFNKFAFYFKTLAESVSQKYSILGDFPLIIKTDIEREIISLFLNHRGPLFIFNACCYGCYPGIKYLIDMRLAKGLETGHGGLTGAPGNSFCYPEIPIHPNMEEKCEPLRHRANRVTPYDELHRLTLSNRKLRSIFNVYTRSSTKKSSVVGFFQRFGKHLNLPIREQVLTLAQQENPDFVP